MESDLQKWRGTGVKCVRTRSTFDNKRNCFAELLNSLIVVFRDSERKSMSVERTFGEINKPAELYKKLYELCESLSEDLIEERYLVSMLLQFTARLKELIVISG